MTYETEPLVRHEHKRTVANTIAADLFEGALRELLWEDYPEIGEYDWEDIVEMVSAQVPVGSEPGEYWRAYDALRVRA